MSQPLLYTGPACPECKGTGATIEKVTTLVVWLHCPTCKHRWVADSAVGVPTIALPAIEHHKSS